MLNIENHKGTFCNHKPIFCQEGYCGECLIYLESQLLSDSECYCTPSVTNKRDNRMIEATKFNEVLVNY